MRLPVFLCAAAIATGHAQAQSAIDENTLRVYVTQQVAGQAGDRVSRFEVRLGTIESQSLAPCRRTEPFMPANSRAWGRSSVGVRCVEGANWTVLVPVTVAVWARTMVATVPLQPGAALNGSDVEEREVEVTRETPAGLTRDAQQLVGRTLVRGVPAGHPVRLDMVKAATVVQAGDTVRLKIMGSGFAVTAAAQALTAATEGQPVRVRTELGKVLTGTARDGRVVEVAL